eukprot:TRINITY_DN806_c0_g1_i4.p1 TRINITY_DN806_c0_g1~~TRINITY_DN806_c0_g1_i4.p1  ORF type:complete len:125 (-),score=35.08 TRINITY_DN806_c0_g1_i4:109-483(-)
MDKELVNRLENEVKEYKAIQTEINKINQSRSSLLSQLGENEMVKKELELQKDGEVYKLVGPVLIKQDLAEANSHVAKRIDYISSELKRLEEIFSDLEKKFEAKRNKVIELQVSLQKQAQKGAVK